MLKLLHLADAHLGKPFQMLGAQGAAQRRALEETFVRAVDLAIAKQVHVVLIAGDLFDSPRSSPALVDLAERELRRLDDRGSGWGWSPATTMPRPMGSSAEATGCARPVRQVFLLGGRWRPLRVLPFN